MTERYLADFAAGQTYGSGRVTVDVNRVKAFAAEFDPQPFHLDVKRRDIRYSVASPRAGGIPQR